MEIERKYLVDRLPGSLESYPYEKITQAYLNRSPVIRIRRSNDDYYLTYKGSGLLAREEYNLPLNRESYEHLLPKADGTVIEKIRYRIPLPGGLTAELDIFKKDLAPLRVVEVEFETIEDASSFQPPEWFGEDVTENPSYQNSTLSKSGLPQQ